MLRRWVILQDGVPVRRYFSRERALHDGYTARQGAQRRVLEGELERANEYALLDRATGDVVELCRSRIVARFSRGKLRLIEQ